MTGRPAAERRVITLTEREQEIIYMLADGLTNQQTANKLFLSVDTIKTHLSRLYGKLGARNGIHAIVVAHRLGLLDLGCSNDCRQKHVVDLPIPQEPKPRGTPLPDDLYSRFPSVDWGEREWSGALDDPDLQHRLVEGIGRASRRARARREASDTSRASPTQTR